MPSAVARLWITSRMSARSKLSTIASSSPSGWSLAAGGGGAASCSCARASPAKTATTATTTPIAPEILRPCTAPPPRAIRPLTAVLRSSLLPAAAGPGIARVLLHVLQLLPHVRRQLLDLLRVLRDRRHGRGHPRHGRPGGHHGRRRRLRPDPGGRRHRLEARGRRPEGLGRLWRHARP